jgi:hypothetical protein
MSLSFVNANAYMAPWCQMEANNAVSYANEKRSGKSKKSIMVEMIANFTDPNYDKKEMSSRDIDGMIDLHLEIINWIFKKENLSLKNDNLWTKRFDHCMVEMRNLQNEIRKNR